MEQHHQRLARRSPIGGDHAHRAAAGQNRRAQWEGPEPGLPPHRHRGRRGLVQHRRPLRAGSTTGRRARRSRPVSGGAPSRRRGGRLVPLRPSARLRPRARPAHEPRRADDPRRQRPLAGIALGAGSIWATSPQDGQLWRIDPRTRLTRTIDVGVGVEFVAFGAGAVWTGNYVDGVVTRVDPRTNRVAARVQVGAVQTLAAGPGGARAGVARGTRDGTLPAPTCSQIASGGRAPDVLIASDLPLQGPVTASTRAQVEAIRLVLAQRGFRAGEHVVGYQSCDHSTAQSGFFEPRKCAANANAYARAPRVVAVIGPSNSYCAQAQIAILNRAPGGPLALVTRGAQRRISPAAAGWTIGAGAEGRSGRLLPDRPAQLLSRHPARRRAGRRARAHAQTARAAARLRPVRPPERAQGPPDRPVSEGGGAARCRDRRRDGVRRAPRATPRWPTAWLVQARMASSSAAI